MITWDMKDFKWCYKKYKSLHSIHWMMSHVLQHICYVCHNFPAKKRILGKGLSLLGNYVHLIIMIHYVRLIWLPLQL